MSIIDRIQKNYGALSRGQKQIAEYIIASPDQICFMTLKEFSDAMGTTAVSVMRFARKLGLEGFAELKKETQAYLSGRLTPNDKLKRAIAVNRADSGKLIDEVFNQDIEDIRETWRSVHHDDVLSAVELLKNADNVYLAAYTMSKGICEFLYYRLNEISIKAQHFNIHETRMMTTKLAQVTPRDAFLIISVSRYSQELVFLAERLKEMSVPVICITDSMTAPFGDCSTVTIACATGTPIFYNSYAPLMAVANVLVSVAAAQLDERVLVMRDRAGRLQKEYETGRAARTAKIQRKLAGERADRGGGS